MHFLYLNWKSRKFPLMHSIIIKFAWQVRQIVLIPPYSYTTCRTFSCCYSFPLYSSWMLFCHSSRKEEETICSGWRDLRCFPPLSFCHKSTTDGEPDKTSRKWFFFLPALRSWHWHSPWQMWSFQPPVFLCFFLISLIGTFKEFL